MEYRNAELRCCNRRSHGQRREAGAACAWLMPRIRGHDGAHAWTRGPADLTSSSGPADLTSSGPADLASSGPADLASSGPAEHDALTSSGCSECR